MPRRPSAPRLRARQRADRVRQNQPRNWRGVWPVQRLNARRNAETLRVTGAAGDLASGLVGIGDVRARAPRGPTRRRGRARPLLREATLERAGLRREVGSDPIDGSGPRWRRDPGWRANVAHAKSAPPGAERHRGVLLEDVEQRRVGGDGVVEDLRRARRSRSPCAGTRGSRCRSRSRALVDLLRTRMREPDPVGTHGFPESRRA